MRVNFIVLGQEIVNIKLLNRHRPSHTDSSARNFIKQKIFELAGRIKIERLKALLPKIFQYLPDFHIFILKYGKIE